jgi:hypothetical protein
VRVELQRLVFEHSKEMKVSCQPHTRPFKPHYPLNGRVDRRVDMDVHERGKPFVSAGNRITTLCQFGQKVNQRDEPSHWTVVPSKKKTKTVSLASCGGRFYE